MPSPAGLWRSVRTPCHAGLTALRFLGKDPNSPDGDPPTVWEGGDDYILQGFTIIDTATLQHVGDMLEGETLICFPKRLMQFFSEVAGGGHSNAVPQPGIVNA